MIINPLDNTEKRFAEHESDQPLNEFDSVRRGVRWDIDNASKNYFSLIASQASFAFFSFFTVWLITRYLGPEGYGYLIGLLTASQVAQLFINWSAFSLTRFGVEEFVERGNINRTFWGRIVIALASTILMLALIPVWVPLLTTWLKLPLDVAPFIVAHFLTSVVWFHLQFALQGAKLANWQGWFLAVERIIVLIAVLSLIISGTATWTSFFLAYIASSIIVCILAIFKLGPVISWKPVFDIIWFRRILAFSLPLFPNILTAYLSTQYITVFFITYYLSVADVGIYTVYFVAAGTLWQLPTLATPLLTSLFVTLQAEKQATKVGNYLQHILPMLTLFWAFGCIAAAFAGSMLLPIVFGPEYSSAKLLWIILAASVINSPVLFAYGSLINAWAASNISFYASLSSAVVNIILNFLLIPEFGLLGCAWATVGSYTVNTLVFAYFVHRREPGGGMATLAATLPALIGAIIVSWLNSSMVGLLAGSICFVLIAVWQRRSLAAGLQSPWVASRLQSIKIFKRIYES